MPYVRVKDNQTGHEFSMPEGTFDEDDVTVLDDKAATDIGGEPLPTKYHTTVEAAAETKRGQAATLKEK